MEVRLGLTYVKKSKYTTVFILTMNLESLESLGLHAYTRNDCNKNSLQAITFNPQHLFELWCIVRALKEIYSAVSGPFI